MWSKTPHSYRRTVLNSKLYACFEYAYRTSCYPTQFTKKLYEAHIMDLMDQSLLTLGEPLEPEESISNLKN